LYDDVSVEEVKKGEKTLVVKCTDKDRTFEFGSEVLARKWCDRLNKILKIRNCNGANFGGEDGRTVFSNTANMFLVADSGKYRAIGTGTLNLVVDSKKSGGIPDVAAIMTVPVPVSGETGPKSHEYLCAPYMSYLKPKDAKTWILHKAMDMHAEFKQQTLAFRFLSESDAQKFQNVFANSFQPDEDDIQKEKETRTETSCLTGNVGEEDSSKKPEPNDEDTIQRKLNVSNTKKMLFAEFDAEIPKESFDADYKVVEWQSEIEKWFEAIPKLEVTVQIRQESAMDMKIQIMLEATAYHHYRQFPRNSAKKMIEEKYKFTNVERVFLADLDSYDSNGGSSDSQDSSESDDSESDSSDAELSDDSDPSDQKENEKISARFETQRLVSTKQINETSRVGWWSKWVCGDCQHRHSEDHYWLHDWDLPRCQHGQKNYTLSNHRRSTATRWLWHCTCGKDHDYLYDECPEGRKCKKPADKDKPWNG